MPGGCDAHSYQNGRTFEQCRQEARKNSAALSETIAEIGQVPWSRVLEMAGHDELVYKLTLKYLRQAGFDIGNGSLPRVALR